MQRYLHKGTPSSMKIERGDNITALTSIPQEAGAFKCIGLNVNHSTLPIVRAITQQNVYEFLPEIAGDIQSLSPAQKAIALWVYAEVQRKCRNGI